MSARYFITLNSRTEFYPFLWMHNLKFSLSYTPATKPFLHTFSIKMWNTTTVLLWEDLAPTKGRDWWKISRSIAHARLNKSA